MSILWKSLSLSTTLRDSTTTFSYRHRWPPRPKVHSAVSAQKFTESKQQCIYSLARGRLAPTPPAFPQKALPQLLNYIPLLEAALLQKHAATTTFTSCRFSPSGGIRYWRTWHDRKRRKTKRSARFIYRTSERQQRRWGLDQSLAPMNSSRRSGSTWHQERVTASTPRRFCADGEHSRSARPDGKQEEIKEQRSTRSSLNGVRCPSTAGVFLSKLSSEVRSEAAPSLAVV